MGWGPLQGNARGCRRGATDHDWVCVAPGFLGKGGGGGVWNPKFCVPNSNIPSGKTSIFCQYWVRKEGGPGATPIPTDHPPPTHPAQHQWTPPHTNGPPQTPMDPKRESLLLCDIAVQGNPAWRVGTVAAKGWGWMGGGGIIAPKKKHMLLKRAGGGGFTSGCQNDGMCLCV